MTSHESTIATAPEPPNIDLLRRYCPTLDLETSTAFAALIAPNATGCWLWPGGLTKAGYGYFSAEPTPYGYSHTISMQRYSYEVFVGDLPMEHHTHHHCLIHACWHPLHLEDVTLQEHADRHRKKKTPPELTC
jgi:hypothetical protein